MLNNSCVYPTDSKKYHEPICYEVLSFRCLFVSSLKVDFLCKKYIKNAKTEHMHVIEKRELIYSQEGRGLPFKICSFE